jgi:hypothetical protein
MTADAELRAALRRAVHRLRRSERRRIFPPAVHVGPLDDPETLVLADHPRPSTPSTPYDGPPGLDRFGARLPADRFDPDRLDVGLRTDLAGRLLERARPGACGAWLTRVGHPLPHDLDAAWLGPLRHAFLEAGREPVFLVVVTKNGWYEPLGEGRRTWQRLRIR